MSRKSIYISTLACFAAVALPMNAQEFHHFAFNAGAGFTQPVGRAENNVDLGWNVHAGFGAHFNSYLGANIDLGFDSMGIKSGVLSNLGFGGGNLDIFSATFNPIIHVNPKGPVDFYITGGGGLYHRYQNFTQPGIVTGTGFDPFFGFYPFAASTNIVVASYSVNKPGVDVGAGIAFGNMWHGKFFAEARYNHIFMGPNRTDYIPVTFGYRW